MGGYSCVELNVQADAPSLRGGRVSTDAEISSGQLLAKDKLPQTRCFSLLVWCLCVAILEFSGRASKPNTKANKLN